MMKTKQETILITGATGTLGSEVVKQLSSATPAVNIKAAVHSAQNVKKVKASDRVETVLIDYNKPETLKEALNQVDKLFLLTPDVPNAHELASNAVIEAKKAGVGHIVKQSVMGADLEADVGTLRLHRQAEKIIEESGIPFTFLRPNEFMQNFVNFHSPSIKNNNAFYLPLEDAKVSLVDVRDIAAVAVKSLMEDGNDKHKNKTYLITGPEALSYHQAAEILSNATGKKISYVNISEEEAIGAMKEMGMSDWLINTISELHDYFREGNASEVSFAVEEVTGKKPISFSQFAKDNVEAFK
ncbi:MAG TPA: SDR family oxidoreductase [Nitrososphaeraceae archaeon]|nr:SDR family oxidoreductase [Nitrososphaeraceae archaeon]